jgi:hypothetical protein
MKTHARIPLNGIAREEEGDNASSCFLSSSTNFRFLKDIAFATSAFFSTAGVSTGVGLLVTLGDVEASVVEDVETVL